MHGSELRNQLQPESWLKNHIAARSQATKRPRKQKQNFLASSSVRSCDCVPHPRDLPSNLSSGISKAVASRELHGIASQGCANTSGRYVRNFFKNKHCGQSSHKHSPCSGFCTTTSLSEVAGPLRGDFQAVVGVLPSPNQLLQSFGTFICASKASINLT